MKDTDIHENIEPVDLNHLLHCLVDPYLGNGRVTLEGTARRPFPGKPLALRRCIGNLVDNALKYGQRAHLHIEDGRDAFVLHVDDEAPACPSSAWSRSSSRTSVSPGSSRATAWAWASRATSPTATAAK